MASPLAQDGALLLPGGLSDVGVAKALDPYRRVYKRIHFKAPVRPAIRRFEDKALQDEFDTVRGSGGSGSGSMDQNILATDLPSCLQDLDLDPYPASLDVPPLRSCHSCLSSGAAGQPLWPRITRSPSIISCRSNRDRAEQVKLRKRNNIRLDFNLGIKTSLVTIGK